MKNKIKLIAIDLDYTLLNDKKEISEKNMHALEKAAQSGVYIVPATGRFYDGMPKCVRELDFVKYIISINGACVFDAAGGKEIYKAEIPRETAVQLIEFTKDYPVAYDCYMNNKSYMNEEFIAEAEKYAPDKYYLEMFKNLRIPAKDLKQMIADSGRDVQKIQWFLTSLEYKAKYISEIENAFPDLDAVSSVIKNIEINIKSANKGNALAALAEYLNIPISQTAAFGDNFNDLTMIQCAGIGIAMENAEDEIKAAADFVTLPYDKDGVAYGIEEICGIKL